RELVPWLRSERSAGRRIWLCTAANERLAASVAAHLDLFEGVLASDARTNLAGLTKGAALVEKFGERGFDYCGNERRDLAIWRPARGAIVVHASSRLEHEAARVAETVRVFPVRSSPLRAVFRALRPHQWAKNVLVAVPVIAAHRLGEPGELAAALTG